MSGPTTAILVADPVTVLISGAIIAANAVREGYQQSAELAQRHQTERDSLAQQQRDANSQARLAHTEQYQQAEIEFGQLLLLAQRLGVADQIQAGRPDVAADDTVAALRALQAYNSEIKTILLTRSASLPDWEQTLPDFSANEPQTVAQRLLGRIAHLGQPPEPIQNLVHQLTLELPQERIALLQNELRRQVQLHLEQSQQQAVQEASALILRHTLQELGYQVEEFSDTLFVEGGVLHFRRHEWGDYMVRLRINHQSNALNFNVIRAVSAASNERSVLDHIAEDRWCSEFPALLKAMEARGLGLDVTRRLQAGELPVQLVDRKLLPAFADAERRHGAAPLKTRTITDE